MSTSKPAPYSTSDTAEVESTSTFLGLIELSRIKADIKDRDKFPNIDGYLEIVSVQNYPIGKLEVQIKKLNEGYVDRPRYNLDTSFFGYVLNVACYPAIIVSVDTVNKRAHWFHVSEEYIHGLDLPQDQETKLIEYPPENVIDGTNIDYIVRWSEIARHNKNKLLEYEELLKISNIVKNNGNSILGEKSTRINEINRFLDFLNVRLDNEYHIVKNTYYPNSRRVGLVFREYEDDNLVYGLYPIHYDENEIPIKFIEDIEVFRETSLRLTGHYVENPIKRRPESYVYQIIKDRLENIFSNILLNNNNSFLAHEFIFAFIDFYRIQMGLDEKDTYDINEIEFGFYTHLPTWIFEAASFMVEVNRNGIRTIADCIRRRPYFDPGSLVMQILGDENQLVLDRVREKLEKKEAIPRVPMGSERYPFKLFLDFILYCKFNGITKLVRPYELKDNWGKSGWIWGQFSQENLRKNMTIFFGNLMSVYNELVSANFRLIQDEIQLFNDAKKIIVLYEDKEEYRSRDDAPTIEIYDLYSDREEEFKIIVMKKDELPELDKAEFEGEINYGGIDYTYRVNMYGSMDFIFNETPMLNYVYYELWNKMRTYLDSKI